MVSVIVVEELHTVIKKKDAQHNSLCHMQAISG